MAKRTWEGPPSTSTGNSPSTLDTSSSVVSTSPPERRKYAYLDDALPEDPDSALMKCSLPPHRGCQSFATYEEYEAHYIQAHVNRCSECRRNFPSDLLLTRHIEENHDPVIEERKARGERTFGCFVEGCDRRCSTPQKRRRHLIDKHCFPQKYNFYIVNDGVDNYSSMLKSGFTPHRRRLSLTTSPNGQSTSASAGDNRPKQRNTTVANGHPAVSSSRQTCEVGSSQTKSIPSSTSDTEDNSAADDELGDLTRSMSALKFVPPSVTLRRQQLKSRGSKP